MEISHATVFMPYRGYSGYSDVVEHVLLNCDFPRFTVGLVLICQFAQLDLDQRRSLFQFFLDKVRGDSQSCWRFPAYSWISWGNDVDVVEVEGAWRRQNWTTQKASSKYIRRKAVSTCKTPLSQLVVSYQLIFLHFSLHTCEYLQFWSSQWQVKGTQVLSVEAQTLCWWACCAGSNLHLILCHSPVGSTFRIRGRKFPARVSGSSSDLGPVVERSIVWTWPNLNIFKSFTPWFSQRNSFPLNQWIQWILQSYPCGGWGADQLHGAGCLSALAQRCLDRCGGTLHGGAGEKHPRRGCCRYAGIDDDRWW